MKIKKIKITLARCKKSIEPQFNQGLKLILCISFFFNLALFANAETITFFADSMNGSASDNNEYTLLSGNAYIKTASMELKADNIELTGTDYRYIQATGNISGTYTESGFAFKCNTIRYDRETEIAVLEGNVSMDDTENDVQLEAQFIEYYKAIETARIQIGVKIVQGKSICTAAFALYRKNLQILELSGSPKIVQGDDIFQAQEITFNLSTEEIILDGKVRGTVTSGETDDTQTSNEQTTSTQTDDTQTSDEQTTSTQTDDTQTSDEQTTSTQTDGTQTSDE